MDNQLARLGDAGRYPTEIALDRIRTSIRSVMLATLSFAGLAAFLASANSGSDHIRMLTACVCVFGGFIVVPATAASFVFDMRRTRRSAELGAFYGFIAYAAIGLIIGLLPTVN